MFQINDLSLALSLGVNAKLEQLIAEKNPKKAEKLKKEIAKKQKELKTYQDVLSKKIYHLCLGGPPGAGKSALVGDLRNAFPNAVVIPTGNICRNLAKEDSERGRKVASYVGCGQLVPMHLFIDVIHSKLLDAVMNTNIIIWDAFVRTAEEEREFIRMTNGGLVAKILKDAPSTEIMRRITKEGRKQCSNSSCGKEHSMEETVCTCGSLLIVRADDNPDIWLTRYDFHKENIRSIQEGMYSDLDLRSTTKEDHLYIINQIIRAWGLK